MSDKELILRYFWFYDTLPSHERFKKLGGKIPSYLYSDFLKNLGFYPGSNSEDGPSKIGTYAALKNGKVLVSLGNIHRVAMISGESEFTIKHLCHKKADGTYHLNHHDFGFRKIDIDKSCHLLFRDDFWEVFGVLKDM